MKFVKAMDLIDAAVSFFPKYMLTLLSVKLLLNKLFRQIMLNSPGAKRARKFTRRNNGFENINSMYSKITKLKIVYIVRKPLYNFR